MTRSASWLILLVMRLLKLKTSVLAIILAVAAFVVLRAGSMAIAYALSPETSLNLFDRALAVFYWPADTLTFLCLPTSVYYKGHESLVSVEVVPALAALLQWYLIFLAGIGSYRHFYRRRHEGVPTG